MAASYILRGSACHNITIGTGKKQMVAGSADDTTIKSGGSQVIFGGGISTSATVSSGGVQMIQSANTSQKNAIIAKFLSGLDYAGRVSGGAVVWNDYYESAKRTGYAKLRGSSLYYSNNISVRVYNVPCKTTTVYSGGKFSVTGDMKGKVKVEGINININISIKNKSITGGASAYVSGCHIRETLKTSGNYLIVNATATADGYFEEVSSSISLSDYHHYYNSTSSATKFLDKSLAALTSKGTALGTEILAGGRQIVTSGAATSTTIYGRQYLKTKALDKAAEIYRGGIQYVSGGASANAAKIYLGGKQHVYAGGETVKTTVYSGGIEYVHKGGIASATKVAKGGSIIVSAGGKVKGLTLAAEGKATLQGGALTGAAKLNGGTLTIRKTGNTAAKLTVAQSAVISYDIRSVTIGAGTMLALDSTQSVNNSFTVVVSAAQQEGTYRLSSNLTLARGTGFTVKAGSEEMGTAKLGKAKKLNGVSYKVTQANGVVTLKLATAAGKMFRGDAGANSFTGTAHSDIFYGGKGNDTITGTNGRDVAVYDTAGWGQDTIKATGGTMTLLFAGFADSDVTKKKSGTSLVLTRKGTSQKVTVEGWNDATHNIVYADTLAEFNKYLNAASPTTAQTTSARNEVWKKAGLAKA